MDLVWHWLFRNCQKITFNTACLFLRQFHSKISYIARYAPDFLQTAPTKCMMFFATVFCIASEERKIGRTARQQSISCAYTCGFREGTLLCDARINACSVQCLSSMHRCSAAGYLTFTKFPCGTGISCAYLGLSR